MQVASLRLSRQHLLQACRILCRVLGMACALPACVAAPAASSRAAPAATRAAQPALHGLDYTITADAELSTLSVRLCMQGTPPARLVFGARSSAGFLRDPRLLTSDGTRSLPRDGDHLSLKGVPQDACIAYDIDLAAALDSDSLLLAYRVENALVSSVELFLWRPPHRPAGMRARARFVLPEGMRVSVPWPRAGDHYELPESTFAFTGRIVLGRFEEHRFERAGCAFSVIVLPGFDAHTGALLPRWIETASAVVVSGRSRFPSQRAQVVVAPSAPSPWPIRFGHMGRGGGVSALVFLPTDTDLDALQNDWIAIHELSHLYLPFVRRQDAWLSEGLATYLQELLRARTGLISRQTALRRLYEGSLLGQQASFGLEHETKIMPVAGNYQRVYWAGAAIMLTADVELHRRTAGKLSLHDLLDTLAAQPHENRPHTAAEILQRLDALSSTRVFTEVAAAALRSPRFPELEHLYDELGVVVRDGDVRFDDAARLASIRDALFPQPSDPRSLALFRH